MLAMLKSLLLAVLFAGLSSSAFAAAPSLFGDMFEPGPSHASFGTHSAKAKTGGSHVVITVDISTQEMTVENDWGTVYTFDVSTGRPGHSTPTGNFRPIRMHDIWYSSKYENAPMPWSIFFHGGYAIHGTTDIKHLGHVASHGCVRLDPKNAKLLYDLVKSVGMKNTKVTLLRS
jgi:lipoprotein-anchoring transpeptidase ErfK/SrfK